MWIEKTQKGTYKFIERYKDPLTDKLKKVSVTMDKNTAATRKLALDELNRKIKEATSLYATNNVTLTQLYDLYISYQKEHVKASTVRRNACTLKGVVSILGKDAIVDRLTSQYIKDKLYSQGDKTENYVKRFKAMITWGYENEYIDNIAFLRKLKIVNEKSARSKVKGKFLETAELKALLEYMESSVPDWYYLTKLMVLSGLRVGEALSLNSSDIGKYISVNKTYDPTNKIFTSPKTEDSIREVYVQPELEELIKNIKVFMRNREKESKIASPLFMHRNGKMLQYYTYNKYLKETSEKIIGRPITTHVLRHTHTSLLAAQGVDLETIARRLGHSDSRITKEIYLHVTKELRDRDNLQVHNTKIL